ncbi:M42 family metallopeptidase [Enterococcus crotali]|uniref:M42 family metallopeptidase n=1 Tax=Enterococcus crotali TaxID=1453587 RepID=UPI000470B464|nr:M42 family peptidase [Enterococcus crotali]
MVKENLRSLLKELTQVNGGSGQEQPVIKAVLALIEPYVDEVSVDLKGNIIALKKGYKEGPNLMFAAHTDEIGLIVKNILPNGFILFEKIGGVPDNLLPGRKVVIGKNQIPGVIGNKPGHLQSPKEAKVVKSASECYVDVAMFSREEVEASGIRIGDQIIWTSDFMEMHNNDYIATKAIDDRICCSILVELFRNIKKEDFAGTLYGVFTVQEEVGLYGAETAVYRVPADYAIALDTIPCGDTPEVNTEIELPIRLNQGPGLPVADGVGDRFFSFIHPAIRQVIENKAEGLSIPLQKVAIVSGGYTTDGAALTRANGGLPAGTLAVPRRYSHSPVELVSLNDVVAVYQIVEAIVKDNENINLSFI